MSPVLPRFRAGNPQLALVFAVPAVLLATAAVNFGGLARGLAWPACSCLLLTAGYAGLLRNVCGKRSDGRLRLPQTLLLLPYLAVYWAAWKVLRQFDTQASCHEIAPALFVGRRMMEHELPPTIELVVDLTSEFNEPNAVRRGRKYMCLPILDGGVPRLADLVQLVRDVDAFKGTTLIHCAEGHGRATMVTIAVLLARGWAPDIPAAYTDIRRHRPRARLQAVQWSLLKLARKQLQPPCRGTEPVP